ncbi:MAG: ParB N-terminal domain-containing protein [Synechococcales bacterium]|nr:ParB N-terminal domain-containing protein [Synechococcales bacterium]
MSQMKKLGGLRQAFQGARDYQQIEGLQSQVEELEAEIAELRSQQLDTPEKATLEQRIAELTQQLAVSGGVHQIPVEQIDRDVDQPRTIFPAAVIQERAESLRTKGQLTPIIVIPQAGDRYRLFEGELRWRAAKDLLNWKTLDAVFLRHEDLQAPGDIFERQIVTSIQSQRLHDLDLAESILKLATYRYANLVGEEERIPRLLHAALRRFEREAEQPDFTTLRIATATEQQTWLEQASFKEVEEQQIFSVILGLQLHPGTINKHIFPLLKLAEDLKTVIRSHGLEGSKARELNRLSADQLQQSEAVALKVRSGLAAEVVQERYSLTEIRARVNQLMQHYNPTQATKSPSTKQLLKAIEGLDVAQVRSPQELETLRSVLQKKLTEVETALQF